MPLLGGGDVRSTLALLFAATVLAGCSAPSLLPAATAIPTPAATPAPVPSPIQVSISPNLAEAQREGFARLAGRPPFAVDFLGRATGGEGELSYAWDFDGDGVTDSTALDPTPYTYTVAGEYRATLAVRDEAGQTAAAQQRTVAIGEPDWPDWRYGVMAHLDWVPFYYKDQAEVERAARMISELGIDVVRFDVGWAGVQPTEREWQWETCDRLAAVSREFGLGLLPILGYSPQWASTGDPNAAVWQDWAFSPPRPMDYAWFAYQAAARYRSVVPAWEVWNEPNQSSFWKPAPDPVTYAELIRQAYLGIKYGNPAAVVVFGGMSNDESANIPQLIWYAPEAFLQAAYDAGAGPYFDAVARHPYTHPNEGTGTMLAKINQLRQVMVANGDSGKPIWLTELGYSALRASGVTDEGQAAWLTQSLDAAFTLDCVPVVIWYNFRDTGTDPNDWGNHYGLIKYNWDLKPAYDAYKQYIADHPGN